MVAIHEVRCNQPSVCTSTDLSKIPVTEITLNPATIQLSPECVRAIRRLRRDRDFTDLLSFYDAFGALVHQS